MSYGMISGALSRGRSTRLRAIFALAVTAAALLALSISSSSASAAFVANGYALGASSTQAGSHPAITLSASNDATQANRNNDDLRTLEFELPAGMLLNPKAVPTPCPTTTFNSGSCSAQTKVGSLSVTYRVGFSNYTVAGTVYSITPDAGSLMSFGLVVNASSKIQKFLIKGSNAVALSRVRSGLDKEYGTTITIPEIPYKVKSNLGFSTDITISNLTMTLDARSGFTSYPVPSLVTAPTRCDAAVSEARFLSYLDVTATRSSSYTPTGCNLVKSEPSFSIAATNTRAGQPTGLSATVYVPEADQDLPIQHSHIKDIAVDLERGTTINNSTLNALSPCSEAQLSSVTCPAESQIGTASLAVSLLVGSMTADIYLTSRDPITFGYVLRGSSGTRMILRGSLDVASESYTGGEIRLNFRDLPQVPWSSASVNLTSKLVNNPSNSCPDATAWAEINGYAGAAMLYGTYYLQTGCAPDTTITSAMPAQTRLRQPSFTFTSPQFGATFECQIDYAGFAPCVSGFKPATPLADGSHVLSVRAVYDGVNDPSPSQYGFTVDATPPTINVTSPAQNAVLTSGTLTLEFTTEPGAVDYCWVDSGPLTACTSPTTFAGLEDGAHDLTVFSRDALGNFSHVIRDFTVATPKLPVVEITSPTDRSTTLLNDVTTNFTATSPSGTAITKIECVVYAVYDEPYEYETERRACADGASIGRYETGDLFRLEVEATDANGQIGTDSVYFIPGQRRPMAPAVDDYVGQGRLTDRTPVFKLVYGDAQLYPDATFDCSLVREGTAPEWAPCGTATNLPDYVVTDPLADGDWTFSTRATAGPRVSFASAMDFSVGPWSVAYSMSTSTQQAGAHPDLDVDIDPDAAGQLKAVDLTLPKGLIGSLNSFAKCGDIVTAVCPEDTKIGTVDVDYQIGGLSGLKRTPGDVYLTDPQEASDVAGMVIRVYSPVKPFADVIIPLRMQLINNAQQMRVFSDSIPTVVGDIYDPEKFTQFWVNDFKMHVAGSAGSPFPLLTNPSRCAPGEFSANFGDTEGNRTPDQTIAYQATGCDALPFEPTITQEFPNTVAGGTTGIITDVTLPEGNSTISTITVNEPKVFGANYASFGNAEDRCPGSAAPDSKGSFDESQCPYNAVVGSMEIISPLLTEPLYGTVYLVNQLPLPYLGVALDGQGISIRLFGQTDIVNVDPLCTGSCLKRIKVEFKNIPDLPLSSIHLDLNQPDRQLINGRMASSKLFVVSDPRTANCVPSSTVDSVFTPHSAGANVPTQQTISTTGC
ncbi:MAG: hypothetical protein JHC98_00430 [Thermoleophilaceae bacterium]|nr:hypothetical protein [Thermoleophilaceae bacterium]